MDASEQWGPGTPSPGSPRMSAEDGSLGESAASQPVSEGLITHLRNLTLDPGVALPPALPENPPGQQRPDRTPQGAACKRRGVRTLLSVRRELRRELRDRMVKIRYQYLNRFSLLQEEIRRKEMEIEKRISKFQCSCHYCLYHRELPEDKTGVDKNPDGGSSRL